MRKLEKLTVIESDYCYNCWRVNTESVPYVVIDPVKKFSQPRDKEVYRASNAYAAADVPYEIREIDLEKYSSVRPYLGIPKNYSDEVYSAAKEGNGTLIACGYCAQAPAILGGLQRAVGIDKKIGMVWIDAHADNRIIEDKSEKETRFVGFPVSTAVGQTYPEWRIEGCGLEIPLEGKNVLASDLRANIPSFDRNAAAAGIRCLNHDEFDDPDVWKQAVEELAEQVDVIYLSVDVDILNPEYIPAYAKVVPDGHTIEKVSENVACVMNTGKVGAYSIFCVDFDLYEMGGEVNYESGRKLIEAGLRSWKKVPF